MEARCTITVSNTHIISMSCAACNSLQSVCGEGSQSIWAHFQQTTTRTLRRNRPDGQGRPFSIGQTVLSTFWEKHDTEVPRCLPRCPWFIRSTRRVREPTATGGQRLRLATASTTSATVRPQRAAMHGWAARQVLQVAQVRI